MKNLFLAALLALAILPASANAAACSSQWSWSTGTCPDYTDNDTSLLGIYSQTVTDSGAGNTVFTRTSVESLIASGLSECVVFGDIDYPCVTAAIIENVKILHGLKGKLVVGTTVHNGTFPIAKSATVASGNAVYHLTSDGTSGGTALCANGNVYLDSLQLRAEEGTNPHSFGAPALSNSNKTLTVPVSKVAPILGILNVGQAANGTVVKATVWCD